MTRGEIWIKENAIGRLKLKNRIKIIRIGKRKKGNNQQGRITT